jgi:DNA (cytosine-5)-methyltransferase 1
LRGLFDLYVGCGGFSLGAKWAGFRTELAIDIDPVLTSSFGRNFKGVRFLLRDATTLTAAEIKELLPDGVDGVIGGPPCQAFSENGAREPDDPRRDLVGEFFRIVSIVRPAFFIMENVRGLGFERNRPVLEAGLGRLDGSWTTLEALLDASKFGAPTRRRRLFVFGFDPSKMAIPDLADICTSDKGQATVRDAIGDLLRAVEVEPGKWHYPSEAPLTTYAKALRSETGAFTNHRFTAHAVATVERFSTVHAGSWDIIGKHPRLAWDGLCPSLLAGTGMDRGAHQSVRPIHPEEHRVITVREAARLQGFPDDFALHPTIWQSFRMIGNSVCPLVAQAVLSSILSAIEVPRRVAAE